MRSRRTPSVPVRRFPDGILLPLTLELPLRLFHGEEFFGRGAAAMAKGLKCFRGGPAAAHILGEQPGLLLVLLLPGGEFLLALPGGLLAVMPFKHPTHPIPPSWWRQAGDRWQGRMARQTSLRSQSHGPRAASVLASFWTYGGAKRRQLLRTAEQRPGRPTLHLAGHEGRRISLRIRRLGVRVPPSAPLFSQFIALSPY
jgi:hypothetical protein